MFLSAELHVITTFMSSLKDDPFDNNSLKNFGVTTEEVIKRLADVYLQNE